LLFRACEQARALQNKKAGQTSSGRPRDPDWIQTNGLLLRRQLLYSAELPGRVALLRPAKIKKIRGYAKPISVAAYRTGIYMPASAPLSVPAFACRFVRGRFYLPSAKPSHHHTITPSHHQTI
jgi:hypothetical protein